MSAKIGRKLLTISSYIVHMYILYIFKGNMENGSSNGAANGHGKPQEGIDEGLYSRQLFVLGKRKLAS